MSEGKQEFSLQELVELTGGELLRGEGSQRIAGVSDLQQATSSDLSFYTPPPFAGLHDPLQELRKSQAGAIFLPFREDHPLHRETQSALLYHENPSQAFQQIASAFFPQPKSGFSGIDPTARIHPSAKIGQHVALGPYVVIDAGAKVGDHSILGAHCFVGAETILGTHCHLHPHVTIREGCQIGHRVVIQPGAIIGGCGFGYTTNSRGEHEKIVHFRGVILEDEVEIGANTTIDRGRLRPTRIGRGSKIDNLVQIAHGVEVGEANLIVAQTGIAGSTRTGKRNAFGGQVAVNGHLQLPDNLRFAARSAVLSAPKQGNEEYYGEPARPKAEYRRFWMHLLRLDQYASRIKELLTRVKQLEEKEDSSPPSL